MSSTPAYGYLSLPRSRDLDADERLRSPMLQYARTEALQLLHVFVDRRDERPARAFQALRSLLAERREAEVVVLPDLGHVAHIPLVAHLSPEELGGFLGCAVRLVQPRMPSPPATAPSPPRPLAIGLVHRPAGTPTADRRWARALVIRHAHEAQLQLIDLLELHDEQSRTRSVLTRLGHLAAAPDVGVLVTEGLEVELAGRLADDLGLVHQVVPQVAGAAE